MGRRPHRSFASLLFETGPFGKEDKEKPWMAALFAANGSGCGSVSNKKYGRHCALQRVYHFSAFIQSVPEAGQDVYIVRTTIEADVMLRVNPVPYAHSETGAAHWTAQFPQSTVSRGSRRPSHDYRRSSRSRSRFLSRKSRSRSWSQRWSC
jgi:hypothetical protein